MTAFFADVFEDWHNQILSHRVQPELVLLTFRVQTSAFFPIFRVQALACSVPTTGSKSITKTLTRNRLHSSSNSIDQDASAERFCSFQRPQQPDELGVVSAARVEPRDL